MLPPLPLLVRPNRSTWLPPPALLLLLLLPKPCCCCITPTLLPKPCCCCPKVALPPTSPKVAFPPPPPQLALPWVAERLPIDRPMPPPSMGPCRLDEGMCSRPLRKVGTLACLWACPNSAKVELRTRSLLSDSSAWGLPKDLYERLRVGLRVWLIFRRLLSGQLRLSVRGCSTWLFQVTDRFLRVLPRVGKVGREVSSLALVALVSTFRVMMSCSRWAEAEALLRCRELPPSPPRLRAELKEASPLPGLCVGALLAEVFCMEVTRATALKTTRRAFSTMEATRELVSSLISRYLICEEGDTKSTPTVPGARSWTDTVCPCRLTSMLASKMRGRTRSQSRSAFWASVSVPAALAAALARFSCSSWAFIAGGRSRV
mmetsp:Transcript_4727/g.13382  ORF Transcript_4727/g.13382 Transcript_4727/m.13382 type:complete len:374 (-) Transcript_4727:442-1563(-)